LKQQLSALSGDNRKLAEALFQREFHTLSGLKHPRIIEVYDYGLDERGPYYTMELLGGKGLRELAPLPYREACSHARDIASSLALLHARRLIHCDVSPNNVRLSSEGRAKLIDFGALATFGTREHVIGTPPGIAPEVVQLMPLDQRADLFSLGALLYWALTGTHAYPARQFTELFEVWQRPVVPPSSLAAHVPRALDELVLSLLSMDPLARPSSAALIIDRLNAIAELDPESDEYGAQSYLLSTPMVGRQLEIVHLNERIDRTLHGQGCAVLIEGPSGIGKSRLLHELCVEAQLRGLTVVQASAEMALDSFALVHTLAMNLLHVAPDVASTEAAAYAPVLGHLSKPLHEALGRPALDALPTDLDERRARLQTALHSWFLAIARRSPLLLAVDNAQAADYNSAAFLAALASDAGAHALFVASTRCSGTAPVAPHAFKTLQHKSARVKLAGLDVAGCEALVRALFGDVSNTGRLARWLHELSGGHPDYCMGLVQLIVAKRIARYVDGTWVLPLEITSSELPSRLDELLEERLARLSSHATALAEAIGVHARALSIEHCLPLLKNEPEATLHRALDELVAEEILMFEANRYRFCHEGMREAVIRRMDAEQRRTMHHTLGEALLSVAGDTPRTLLEAGLHLLNAGEETRGADLLAVAGRKAMAGARAADDAALAVRALTAAIDVYRKQQRSEYELAPLLLTLAPLCYYVDWRLAVKYGRDALELGFRITGLTRALELKRFLGSKLALLVALGIANGRFRRANKRGASYGLRDAIIETCAAVPSVAGVYAICLDAEGGRELAQLIAPLELFGRKHIGSVIYDNGLTRMLTSLGRETEAAELIAANRVRLASAEFDAVIGASTRKAFYAGELFSYGLIKASSFGDEALECARCLDELGIRLWSMVADQVRMMYHANRGELSRAKEYQQKIELHVVQGGTTWQTDIFLPVGMLGTALISRDALA
ncbi:MAG TPA: AAA family ATPase, partial [Polyangiaceae bacterium]|nr:AAA family ATPase [Polyangiaceae bacterium]